MAENKRTHSVSFFNSTLISIISISLVLFLIGLFFIVGMFGNELSIYMKEHFSFSIILKEDPKEVDVRKMQRNLNSLPFIKSTKYISKEDAAKEMTAELGEDPQVFLGFNPFQASIEVQFKSEYMNPDSLRVIEKKLTSYAGVSELLYQKDMIHIVNSNIHQIGVVLSVLIFLLILISFTLINNTIRLLIYSRRFLIYTMRLVGATPGFILWPFVKHNMISGFFSGVLAILMLAGTLYLQQKIIGLEVIISQDKLWVVYGIILITGVFLSAVSAYMSVSRYLRMERGKMYSI